MIRKLFLTRLSDILILAEIKDKTTENKEEFSDAELNLTNTLKIIKSNISSEEESFIDNDCTERFSVHCKINNLLNIVISIVTESEFSKEIAHHFLNEIDEIINNKINSSFISSQSTPNGLSHLNSFFQQKTKETVEDLEKENEELYHRMQDYEEIKTELNLFKDREQSGGNFVFKEINKSKLKIEYENLLLENQQLKEKIKQLEQLD